LVMPAIEPGWDAFLAGAAAFTNARASSADPSLFLLGAVAPPPLTRRPEPDADTFAFTRVPE
jgi:hypothetical protein